MKSTDVDVQKSGVEPDGANVGTPARSMLGTLRVVGSLVAPTTLVVALLYYFGWARTSTQAFVMGLDESLFGYSTTDYILRSITSMFWPLLIAAAVLLVAVLAHGRLVEHRDPSLMRGVSLAAGSLGLMFLALGLTGSALDQPSRFVSLAAPLAVMVSIALLAYAWYLRGLPPARSRGGGVSTPAAGLAWSLVTVLLLLSAFWTVSHYAAIVGIDFAREVERLLPSRPSVTIYSPTRLHLEPPVVEATLPGDESAYRFRYTGMKLLFRADQKLFLRPSDPSSSRNIVIPEDIGIRVEYE